MDVLIRGIFFDMTFNWIQKRASLVNVILLITLTCQAVFLIWLIVMSKNLLQLVNLFFYFVSTVLVPYKYSTSVHVVLIFEQWSFIQYSNKTRFKLFLHLFIWKKILILLPGYLGVSPTKFTSVWSPLISRLSLKFAHYCACQNGSFFYSLFF